MQRHAVTPADFHVIISKLAESLNFGFNTEAMTELAESANELYHKEMTEMSEMTEEPEAPRKFNFVSAYGVTRHYGGPEEGGWWYNHYQRLETRKLLPTDDEAVRDSIASQLYEKHKDIAYGDIGSVLGGEEVSIYFEEEAGEHETTSRPRYE